MLSNDLENSKYICLHGVKITNIVDMTLKIEEKDVNITFVPYNDFLHLNIKNKLINANDIVECSIIVIIDNCNNNTLETQIAKIAVSILYFANRMSISNLIRKSNVRNGSYNDFFKNCDIDGFRDETGGINHASWFVKFGKNQLSNDDFERWLTRAFGNELQKLYKNRDGMANVIQANNITIDVNENLIEHINLILSKICRNDEYSRKLVSSFRLYFDLLCDYQNPDQNVISFCTILETLLLAKDEDNQRKKAAIRASCIVANNISLYHKKFVANQVYFFYKYRNGIVHDGKGIMDFDEMTYTITYRSIKHIIFSVIQYIMLQDIKSTKEIVSLVNQNLSDDHLENGFDYIDFKKIDNNEPFSILFFDEYDYIDDI